MDGAGRHGAGPDDPGAEPGTGSARLVRRKTVLRAALAATAAIPVALAGGPALARTAAASGKAPELTPSCDDGDHPTPEQTEGPYFKPNSPQRTSLLEPGMPGTPLTVTGYVFGRACLPVAGVLLDFWQADANGAYDNTGFRLRGHQFTDSRGSFALTTIVPGLYPGRTRHLHVKLQAPGRPVLTTQLYFPNEPRNNTDTIFDARLLMTVRDAGGGREAAFDFVLDVPQDPGPGPGPSPSPGGTWAVGTAYRAGDRVTYAGRAYVCLQAHTAQPGWEPPSVPALWRAA
ncbi:dioxygenase [Streptomyces longwoodensis]|uniref:dioxygenase family protein n=1 Tax=Streptomyces longwoodensis TaxID=68231 RepID=UPI00225AF660|nr:carbohydrate-binding protein [Streptomyces longwoodensis]MCX4997309.1 dioxygenase [Streptomyces longwoodensis]WRY91944.1 dioxygenase [Streptomyces longwoodensis]WTI43767.1 dioxygenase [Streptomyces longwoodensis]WUC56540.1 dioxygenase [Streptomyces longwoodensis]WUC70067.1 dioxygenase [Streptomyces longwoodensis]